MPVFRKYEGMHGSIGLIFEFQRSVMGSPDPIFTKLTRVIAVLSSSFSLCGAAA
jgi:hypothetical protein